MVQFNQLLANLVVVQTIFLEYEKNFKEILIAVLVMNERTYLRHNNQTILIIDAEPEFAWEKLVATNI